MSPMNIKLYSFYICAKRVKNRHAFLYNLFNLALNRKDAKIGSKGNLFPHNVAFQAVKVIYVMSYAVRIG